MSNFNVRQRAPMGQPPARQPQGNAPGHGIQRFQSQAAHAPQTSRPQNGAAQMQQPPRQPGGVTGVDNVRRVHEQQRAEEQRRAQQRQDGYQPFRFYLPSPTKPGITQEELEANIIILDHEPGFAVFEHQFPDPQTGKMGRGSFTQLCLSGEGHCPACDADKKDPYYALFLSVLDLRSYTKQDGTFVPYTKKLLVVKNKNQDWFFRKFDQQKTLRGLHALMVRNDPRGANHGNPDFITMISEDDILQNFAHPRVMSQDGQRVIKEENADCYAYDYNTLFPKPDYNEMLERFGGTPAAGSGADYASAFGRDAGQFNQVRGRPGGFQLASSTNRNAGMQGYGDEPDGDSNPNAGYGAPAASFTRGRHEPPPAIAFGDMDDEIPFDDARPTENSGRTGSLPEDEIPL